MIDDRYFGYTSDEFIKKFAEAQWGDLDERIAKGSLTQAGVHSYLCHIFLYVGLMKDGRKRFTFFLIHVCINYMNILKNKALFQKIAHLVNF